MTTVEAETKVSIRRAIVDAYDSLLGHLRLSTPDLETSVVVNRKLMGENERSPPYELQLPKAGLYLRTQ